MAAQLFVFAGISLLSLKGGRAQELPPVDPAPFFNTQTGPAVEYWRDAIKSFPALPPAYSESEGAYDEHRKISLVGLFNTRHNPTVDCALVTCHPGAKDEEEGQESGDGEEAEDKQEDDQKEEEEEKDVADEDEGGNDFVSAPQANPLMAAHPSDQVRGKTPVTSGLARRLTADDAPTHGLVCLSRPQTLHGTQPPFTEELWGKITGAENSSAQHEIFALCASAAAALVHSLF
ncbi:hypothetical protein Emag_006061 [Eimeria magna]